MAGALRPVVLLMLLASMLLVADGMLDGVRPGGDAWLNDAYYGLAGTSYLFALINLLVAILVARGSERSLIGRIGLSGFFLVERPLTAFVLGPKPAASVAVHAMTALVELVILLGALRVWRLGRRYADDDLEALFAVGAPAAGPSSAAGAPPVAGAERAWLLGLGGLGLAGLLAADAVAQGYVPGGKSWGTAPESAGWLGYAFSVMVLSVSASAMRGTPAALRVLFLIALLIFLERAFSPFVFPPSGPVDLALHIGGAFVALGLALASAGARRVGPLSKPRLEAA